MGKWEPTGLALIFHYTFAGPSNNCEKKEKTEYENHTHFKYDSQININL